MPGAGQFQRQFAAAKEINLPDFGGHLLGKGVEEGKVKAVEVNDIPDDVVRVEDSNDDESKEEEIEANTCSPIESICLLERKRDRAKVQMPILNEMQEKAANEFLLLNKEGYQYRSRTPRNR